MQIYGINAVIEALRAKRATLIRVSPRADDRLTEVVRMAEAQGVRVERVGGDALDRLGGRQRHHGVIADVAEAASYSGEDLVFGGPPAPPLRGLAKIEEPHHTAA